MPKRRLDIDRLSIEVPGISAGAGRELAAAVASALAAADGLPAAGDIPTLRVELVADPGLDPPELARRIVAATLQALQRAP